MMDQWEQSKFLYQGKFQGFPHLNPFSARTISTIGFVGGVEKENDKNICWVDTTDNNCNVIVVDRIYVNDGKGVHIT